MVMGNVPKTHHCRLSHDTPSHRERVLTQLLSCSVIQIEQKTFPDGIKMHAWMTAANSSQREAKVGVMGAGKHEISQG